MDMDMDMHMSSTAVQVEAHPCVHSIPVHVSLQCQIPDFHAYLILLRCPHLSCINLMRTKHAEGIVLIFRVLTCVWLITFDPSASSSALAHYDLVGICAGN